MLRCKQCKHSSGTWCEKYNKITPSTICCKFEMNMANKVISKVKRVFEKGW